MGPGMKVGDGAADLRIVVGEGGGGKNWAGRRLGERSG